MKQLYFILFFSLQILSAQDTLPKLTFSLAKTASLASEASIILTVITPEEYHLYGNPLGPGVGKPTTITPSLSSAVTWISATTITTTKFVPEGFENEWVWSWYGKVPFILKACISDSTAPLSLIIDGLICKNACIPVRDTITCRWDTLPVISQEELTNLEATTPFPLTGMDQPKDSVSNQETVLASEQPVTDATTSFSLWWALFLAFLAGVILNVMPCVLPVLGIKIIALAENAHGSKKSALLHSFSFAAGMLSIFFLLATLAVLITQAGSSWAWGQQFQSSIFTVSIIAIIFVFSLGMFDLFIILVPPKLGELEQKVSHEKLWGSFFKGTFATILATPCSGPLLGGVLAWALTGQSPIIIYAIFGAVGIGMATPYILLASSRRLTRLIPKPGMWMEDLKHFLGFLMIGFAIWLMGTLPSEKIIPTLGLLLTLSAIIMVYGRIAPFGSSIQRKVLAIVGLGLIVVVVALSLFKEKEPTLWEPFEENHYRQAIRNHESVVIDFTAAWCMNCQSNKALVYETKEVTTLLTVKKVRAFRADLTNRNPVAEKYRDAFGSKSVPFLVIIPQGDTTNIIRHRDIVSKRAFIEDIEALK